MKTAPFDLEKALAGHPLVTRDGSLVSRFGFTGHRPLFPYEALVNGFGEESFTEKGSVYYTGDDPNDLFLYLGDAGFEDPKTLEAHIADLENTVKELKGLVDYLSTFLPRAR